jgi:hypothetical protein
MTIRTHITRNALALVACAATAALAAPAALADPPQGHRVQLAQPDLVERYVASGRGQADLVERWVDGRAGQPDLLERYIAIRRPVGFPDGRPDGYQPQRSTSLSASPAATSADGGFGWTDVGIGALAGFALMLVAGGTLLAARGRGRIAHS